MKKIVIAAALIVSGLLVGCNQLTQYTVSEQEINQALEKHNNFSKDIGVPGGCTYRPDESRQPDWARGA